MKNILHISERIETASGGSVTIKRNKEALIRFFGKENISYYELCRKKKGTFKALWTDLTNLSFYGLDKSTICNILGIIKDKNIEVVFLDTSNLGILAKAIKNEYPQIKIITFFHNIEFKFFFELFTQTKNIKFLLKTFLSYINEKLTCRYSDWVIVLNKRDEAQLKNIYGRIADLRIPISLPNTEFNTDKISGEYILFVGSNFPPNIQGITFFINKVLTHIPYKLFVAGSGMEHLKGKYEENNKLEIHGFVEDLEALYAKAHFVVLPIFSGSGMKVKTAEAFKYGKYVMAAPEALVGYEYTDSVAKCCKDADSFIKEINKYDPLKPNFNRASRDLFEMKYSNEAVFSTYRDFFSKL